jgi:hypothetical protein
MRSHLSLSTCFSKIGRYSSWMLNYESFSMGIYGSSNGSGKSHSQGFFYHLYGSL